MNLRRWLFGAVVCLLAIVAATAWWRRSDDRKAAPPRQVVSRAIKPLPPSQDYVGSAACAACHAEIAESYSQHPMWSSLGPVSPDAPYFTEALLAPGGMCSYAVSANNGRLFHHEAMRDSSGRFIYDQAVRVDYAIGSGTRGWSFLISRGELMFMSPLTWYSTTGEWDLSPAYRPDDPRRFGRPVTGDCLHCHSGRVAVEPGNQNRYKSPPFFEASIGCERCHGPGKEHVAYHESGGISGRDLMVNPARLEPLERESVCDQCHLQADARIPRYGRTHLDFRPGQQLSDVATIFTLDYGDEQSARAVRHVHQMHASRCFQASNGAMGCTSCHDAHSVPKAEEKVNFYRQKCIACHQAEPHCALPEPQRRERSAADSCIECHMPPLAAADVAHTAQTDHRILRDPAAAPLIDRAPERPPTLEFFGQMRESLEPWEADRALGLALFHAPLQGPERAAHLQRVEMLLAPVLERAPDDSGVLNALGAICLEGQRFDEAAAYFAQALKLDGQDEAALFGLANLAEASGDSALAARRFDQLLAINDSSAEIYARKAELLGTLNRWEAGIEAAEKGLQLNPRLVSLRGWVVDAYRRVGRHDRADAHHAILEQMRTVWRGPQPGGSSRISN
jgi:hypothetical protein